MRYKCRTDKHKSINFFMIVVNLSFTLWLITLNPFISFRFVAIRYIFSHTFINPLWMNEREWMNGNEYITGVIQLIVSRCGKHDVNCLVLLSKEYAIRKNLLLFLSTFFILVYSCGNLNKWKYCFFHMQNIDRRIQACWKI